MLIFVSESLAHLENACDGIIKGSMYWRKKPLLDVEPLQSGHCCGSPE